MKRFILYLSVMTLVAMTSCQPPQQEAFIGYVQITEDPVLDAAKAGVFRALADSGFVEGKNLSVIDHNAQGNLSMINTILQSIQSQNVDLIITNSTPCMASAAQTVRTIPVVFTVAFGPEQIGLKSVRSNLYGVFDPMKSVEFVDLVMACIPGIQRIGIPFNNAEPNAQYSFKKINEELVKRGITVVAAAVNSTNDIPQAAQYLASQSLDAIVVAADNTVYLGLPILAKLASEKKIPIFVSDPLQTQKGACLGFGPNYDQWGYQAGQKAVEVLRGRSISAKDRIEPVAKFELIINKKACMEMGVRIPESVSSQATRTLN